MMMFIGMMHAIIKKKKNKSVEMIAVLIGIEILVMKTMHMKLKPVLLKDV